MECDPFKLMKSIAVLGIVICCACSGGGATRILYGTLTENNEVNS